MSLQTILHTCFCSLYITGTSHTHYNQTVLQTQKLPQHKPKPISLQPVAQTGIKPVSLAHQSSALVYLYVCEMRCCPVLIWHSSSSPSPGFLAPPDDGQINKNIEKTRKITAQHP
eukprot:4159990-Ditylum_brightwellii.AAC.1